MWREAGRRPVVKSSPDIFNNPIDTLYDIVSSHSTARHDRPLVGLDSVQVESLKPRQSTTFIAKIWHDPTYHPNLGTCHRSADILFVRKHEQGCSSKPLSVEIRLHHG